MSFTALAWTEPETSICNYSKWQINLSFCSFEPRAFFPHQDCGENGDIRSPEALSFKLYALPRLYLRHSERAPVVGGLPQGLCSLSSCAAMRTQGVCVLSAWVLVESRTRPVTEMWNLQGACLSRCSQYLKSVWLCDAQVSVLRNASKLQPRVGLLVS